MGLLSDRIMKDITTETAALIADNPKESGRITALVKMAGNWGYTLCQEQIKDSIKVGLANNQPSVVESTEKEAQCLTTLVQ